MYMCTHPTTGIMWECHSATNTIDAEPSLWVGQKEMFQKSREKFCLPYYSSHISGLKFCSSPLAGAKPSLPWTTMVSNKHSRAGGGTFPCQIPNSCSFAPSIRSALPVAE